MTREEETQIRGRGGWLAAGFALLCALLLAPGPAAAQESPPATAPAATFAGLTITAYGEQEFDLATGLTTLTDGGEIRDRDTGVVLTGRVIRYRDDELVEAEGSEVTGNFGRIGAERVRIDVPASVLTAEGGLGFQRGDTTVTAGGLTYYAETDVLLLTGAVEGSEPAFTASALALDGESGAIVLVGPYRYQDGPFTLTSESSDALLQLTPTEDGYAVASQVSEQVLARLRAYLP